jgi:hypothetical protein
LSNLDTGHHPVAHNIIIGAALLLHRFEERYDCAGLIERLRSIISEALDVRPVLVWPFRPKRGLGLVSLVRLWAKPVWGAAS